MIPIQLLEDHLVDVPIVIGTVSPQVKDQEEVNSALNLQEGIDAIRLISLRDVKLQVSMAGCDHRSCGGSEKVWLPYSYRGRERCLKPHPFCTDCGLVKNLSSERPRDLGYYMNILSVLGRRYKIVQVQKRLVAMEMERLAFDDGYGMDRKMQEKLFVEIVTRILNVPERDVTVILEAP